MVVILLFMLSFAFTYAGKIESVVFDKNIKAMQLVTTSVICKKEEKNFRISEIKGIKAYRSGHDGVNVYTVHFKILVVFDGMPSIKIMETLNREKAIK